MNVLQAFEQWMKPGRHATIGGEYGSWYISVAEGERSVSARSDLLAIAMADALEKWREVEKETK